jgi:hypothetical protein
MRKKNKMVLQTQTINPNNLTQHKIIHKTNLLHHNPLKIQTTLHFPNPNPPRTQPNKSNVRTKTILTQFIKHHLT